MGATLLPDRLVAAGRAWLRGLLAVVPVVACSCTKVADHPPTYPVRGQVLYEGQPAPGVLVVFHPLDQPGPGAPRAYARTAADGSFALATFAARDGAPAGRYAVTVIWQDGEEGTNLLPSRYASPAGSGLQAEVRAGANELSPFRLRGR